MPCSTSSRTVSKSAADSIFHGSSAVPLPFRAPPTRIGSSISSPAYFSVIAETSFASAPAGSDCATTAVQTASRIAEADCAVTVPIALILSITR